MMSNSESQEEEKEVLLSIYEGDECFKQVSPTVYQYKYGKENDPKSFLVEISWNKNYPTQKPDINMDTFYNKHLLASVKDKIINAILEEAEQYLGAAMTYSIFEFVKEKESELIQDQPETIVCNSDSDNIDIRNLAIGDQEGKKATKKVMLTKAQKRRQWDKVDSKGEKPRGWNWVDVVKHLSQTGPKTSPEPEQSKSTSS